MFATAPATPRATRLAARYRDRAARLEARAAEGRPDSEARYDMQAQAGELRRRADRLAAR